MMARGKPLFLYEEIMLLALRDEQGTIATGFPEQVVAGAILAELLLEGRIAVEDTRKKLVNVLDSKPTGDPIIDECLEKMSTAKRRASLQTWVSRLAGTKNLRHKAAQQLCDRRILRADEDKILFVFKRRIYPEIDPMPEKKIIDRLRDAIYNDHAKLDPRTVVLISLANGSDMLRQTFGRKEIKARKKRIEQIENGELTGKATKEVIAACQTALIVAAIMPAMISTTVHN
jgi:Golgi phosphoprotein 3